MISRRRVILAIGAGALLKPLTPLSQTPKTLRRIGALNAGTPSSAAHLYAALRGALSDLGWVEGRDFVIEWRWANGEAQLLDTLAAELVALKPDLIFAPVTISAQAAQRATRDIPIVFAVPLDPVGSGLIASLAQPGGNTTGLTTLSVDLGAKRLQLLRECVPALSRVAVLFDPAPGYPTTILETILNSGKQFGIEMAVLNASNESEIDAAFGKLSRERPDGIFVMDNPLNFRFAKVIAARVAAARIPAIYPYVEYADAGGLLVYGVNFVAQFKRVATYVDKIFKGAKPSDLPVEQPTKFELVINLKTAKALGLKIPQSILLRADRVIE